MTSTASPAVNALGAILPAAPGAGMLSLTEADRSLILDARPSGGGSIVVEMGMESVAPELGETASNLHPLSSRGAVTAVVTMVKDTMASNGGASGMHAVDSTAGAPTCSDAMVGAFDTEVSPQEDPIGGQPPNSILSQDFPASRNQGTSSREEREAGLEGRLFPLPGAESSPPELVLPLVTCAGSRQPLGAAVGPGSAGSSSVYPSSKDFIQGAHQALDHLGEVLMAHESDVADREEATADREFNVWIREEEADKVLMDLHDEDARLEQLHKVLDAREAWLNQGERAMAAREDAEKELADCMAELRRLEGQESELGGHCERRGDELLRLGEQHTIQGDMLQDICQRAFVTASDLGISLRAPAFCWTDDIGRYAQFIKELVVELEEAKRHMHETVRKEGHELLEQVRDHIFSNLYMLNAHFPFDEVLKLP